jgi:hypothetical protein
MQLGKSIVGAIIGAALGIGLLVALYLTLQLDKVWLAIPVAILTGLGVRMLVTTWGHPSYLRGAMTGVVALMAYLLAWYLVAGLAQRASANTDIASERPAAVEKAPEEEVAEEPGAEAPPPPKPVVQAPRATGTTAQRSSAPRGFSTMDFLWLCIAALVAYELGRGTAATPVVVVGEATTAPEAAQGAHPDA